MSDSGKKLDDLLLHYGVKGMKWENRKFDPQNTSDSNAGGDVSEQKLEDDLNKIGNDIQKVKDKVGNGHLDMLKYVIFGNDRKSKNESTLPSLDILGTKIKKIKGMVGDGPLDMLKYIITGKNKIQHSGVKGMKWGIHRNHDRHGGADGRPDANDKLARTTLGKNLNSLKRERQWKSVLKEMDKLSTKDITVITKRVSLENALKTLSRSKVGTKKDREDYLRREHINDEELSRKVVRLKAKEGLHSAVHSASKEQREFGQKLVQIGGSIGVKYALTKTVSGKDLFEIVKNPKSSADKAKQDLLKVALEKVKAKQSKP